MLVIGVIGHIGSGKDEFVEYLQRKFAIPVISVGDIVRELAMKENLQLTRENLHQISTMYFNDYGNDYFIKQTIKRIHESKKPVVGITGIRTPMDAKTLREHFGDRFFLAHVVVDDPRLRYERLKKRASERDSDDYQNFLEQDRAEEEMFRLSEAVQYSNETIHNNGTLDDFHEKIDEIVREHKLMSELLQVEGF